MKYYGSPRWTGEILDCSMPVTLDTYNKCSYNCLYCFSFFQKSHSMGKGGTRKKDTTEYSYQGEDICWINPKQIERMVSLDPTLGAGELQFESYFRDRKVIQWGGLADQFDEYERKHGITLEVLKIFKQFDYPICFSTKATWWVYDERYRELFRGQKNWNVKISIINLDETRAKRMEKGVDSPLQRLAAMKELTSLGIGGVTLRLRPFIIGFTNRKNEHLELIRLAKENGATAVSTEFFCLEARADDKLKERYTRMSNLVGFDIYEFYRTQSKGAGYRRLNYAIKEKFVNEMQEECDKLGMRFYVSDAHHKERCPNGSCCGLDDSWNYSRGQFTEALVIAKNKGKVLFSDIEPHLEMYKKFQWCRATGFNTSTMAETSRRYYTMYDYFREIWNSPNSAKSPYKYFSGVLYPIGLDEQKNVIYEFRQPTDISG